MRNVGLYFLLFIIVFSTSFLVSGQGRESTEIKRIDAYSKSVDAFVKKNEKPHLIFADISRNAKPKWRKFASTDSLEKFRESTETYIIANNWLQNGKIVLSVFTLFSESGDWAKYVYSYFRQDGTLAKAETDYRTFYGDFVYLENSYFGAKGKLLAKTAEFKDLDRKPKMPDKDDLKENAHIMNAVDYYKSAGKLPYAHLVR
ncbi:MAG: hypothetical protein M3449_09940 [Acidobacteriota bacterium]|jgi:hypothetical protein|nr:hypothetical protein [Acidobacteriota bacterium]